MYIQPTLNASLRRTLDKILPHTAFVACLLFTECNIQDQKRNPKVSRSGFVVPCGRVCVRDCDDIRQIWCQIFM